MPPKKNINDKKDKKDNKSKSSSAPKNKEVRKVYTKAGEDGKKKVKRQVVGKKVKGGEDEKSSIAKNVASLIEEDKNFQSFSFQDHTRFNATVIDLLNKIAENNDNHYSEEVYSIINIESLRKNVLKLLNKIVDTKDVLYNKEIADIGGVGIVGK
nr:hypothetical protein TetV2_00113 [Oceanusvirus sp.]